MSTSTSTLAPVTDGRNTTSPITSSSNNTPTSAANTCASDDILLFVYSGVVFFFIAVVVLVLMSFATKRKRLCPGVCGGRPALLTPIDFISSQSNRLPYLVTFGSATSSILSMFLSFLSLSGTFWLNTVVSLVIVSGVALIYAPLLVCVEASNRLLGYCVGFLYSTSWLITKVSIYTFVYSHNNFYQCFDVATIVLETCPFWLLLSLACWYGYKLVITWRRKCRKQFCVGSSTDGTLPYQANYVKRLLRKDTPTDSTRLHTLISYFYEWDPFFRYPTRLLVTLLVSGLCMLYLVVLLSDTHTVTGKLLSMNTLFPYHSDRTGIVSILARTAGESIPTCIKLALVSSLAVIACQMIHIMIKYKSGMKRLCRGDKSFLTENLPSPAVICRMSVKYSGCQIAFILWGWLINTLVFFVLFLVVAFFYWWIKLDTTKALTNLANWLTPVFVAAALWIIQVLLSKFVFLEGRGAHITLTNRKLFMNFSYFYFFYGILVGFFTCLQRIIIGMVIGVLQLLRLDQCLLPRGWETWDAGYNSFVGTLLLDYNHSNPCMLTFLYLLRQNVSHKWNKQRWKSLGKESLKEISQSGQNKPTTRSCLAQNRWMLAYTLINNPSLIKMRSSKSAGKAEHRHFVCGLMASKERPQYESDSDDSGDENATRMPLLGKGHETTIHRYDEALPKISTTN